MELDADSHPLVVSIVIKNYDDRARETSSSIRAIYAFLPCFDATLMGDSMMENSYSLGHVGNAQGNDVEVHVTSRIDVSPRILTVL